MEKSLTKYTSSNCSNLFLVGYLIWFILQHLQPLCESRKIPALKNSWKKENLEEVRPLKNSLLPNFVYREKRLLYTLLPCKK